MPYLRKCLFVLPTGSQTQQAGCARLQSRAFFVPEEQSGSLLTECSYGAKNPGKARHILRPPAYVRSPAAQGLGKSRPARLNPNQITIQHPQPRHPKTVCYTQLHISQCLIETFTNYAIYRLKTFTACLLSRYPHTLLYDIILHGIIG